MQERNLTREEHFKAAPFYLLSNLWFAVLEEGEPRVLDLLEKRGAMKLREIIRSFSNKGFRKKAFIEPLIQSLYFQGKIEKNSNGELELAKESRKEDEVEKLLKKLRELLMTGEKPCKS